MTYKNLVLLFLIVIPLFSIGQTTVYTAVCFEYHKSHCVNSENIYYKYNNASRSALFVKGQKSHTKLEVFNGRDYRISICADDIFEQKIELRIIDGEDGTILYDNTNDDLAQEFEFTVVQSKELILEVLVRGISHENGENGRGGIVRRDDDIGCVGLLIEYMITPKKGF